MENTNQTFYIYYHFEGYAFDAEWDDLEKTTVQAYDFEDATSKFKQIFPKATIMSIDNKD